MWPASIRQWGWQLAIVFLTIVAVGAIGVEQARADPILAAAGDIACPGPPPSPPPTSTCRQAATASEIAAAAPTAVAALGDNQYEGATLAEFTSAGAFADTWGASFKALIHPVPGNHEYGTAGAAGYFSYFGVEAGPQPQGYYSYDLGGWHIIALNSNCTDAGCGAPYNCNGTGTNGSNCGQGRGGTVSAAEVTWLQADLAAHPGVCTLAYWHHPRFTSGYVQNSLGVAPLWQALYEARADVVLNGHDHSYERFAQQDPAQAPTTSGIREFVVGTGGEGLFSPAVQQPNSEYYDNNHFGALFLVLHARAYEWKFQGIDGAVLDSSSTPVHCHATSIAPSAPSIASPADGSYANSHTVTLAGTAEPSSTVKVFEGLTMRTATTADAAGAWSSVLSEVPDGRHSYTASATDAAHYTGPLSNPVTVTIDTVAPGAPTITSPVNGGHAPSHTVTFAGTAEPNSTVKVFEGLIVRAATTANSAGAWSSALNGVPDGRHSYTANATDAASNTGPPSNAVTVAVDTIAPVSGFRMSPTSFAVGDPRSARRHARPRGSVFRFQLTAIRVVHIGIGRLLSGRRRGAACVAIARRHTRGRSCTRVVSVGTLTLNGVRGANSVPFSGRLGWRALPPGRYQATIEATNAAGLRASQTISFTVVRG